MAVHVVGAPAPPPVVVVNASDVNSELRAYSLIDEDRRRRRMQRSTMAAAIFLVLVLVTTAVALSTVYGYRYLKGDNTPPPPLPTIPRTGVHYTGYPRYRNFPGGWRRLSVDGDEEEDSTNDKHNLEVDLDSLQTL
ncbi:hypothetical protein Emed_006015 [Eimeria media]